ncbi:pre-mRNA-splicing factor 38B-like [Dysidea avara]|uniref:pre-mRNA-splicing factor 38B-like n=1 Tax=Dysidea avara TaxID=196820 RepID=UPI0033236E8D
MADPQLVMAAIAAQQYAEQQQQLQSAEEGEEISDGQMKRFTNTLPLWGNKETMNINHLILSNIRGSPYFKTDLFKLKTYHEVIDEIYYKVTHLEPWEKNSRKTAGQIGMCAGVRGVSAGGIVSTAYCILFKLFTLKLTRKQLTGMLNHVDSPYIRGLGFLYIRYCQPPSDFTDWFEPYFDDDEEIDLKAGGGFQTTVGEMCKMMVSKLDWFGTLFPRIPVNLQKMFMEKFKQERLSRMEEERQQQKEYTQADSGYGEAEKRLKDVPNNSSRGSERSRDASRERRPHRSRSRSRERRRSRERSSRNDRDRRYRSPNRRRSGSRERRRDRSRERNRSRERRRSRSRERKYRQRSRSPRH